MPILPVQSGLICRQHMFEMPVESTAFYRLLYTLCTYHSSSRRLRSNGHQNVQHAVNMHITKMEDSRQRISKHHEGSSVNEVVLQHGVLCCLCSRTSAPAHPPCVPAARAPGKGEMRNSLQLRQGTYQAHNPSNVASTAALVGDAVHSFRAPTVYTRC